MRGSCYDNHRHRISADFRQTKEKHMKNRAITVQGAEIAIATRHEQDYISLTDMLKAKDGGFFISDWLRNRNTVKFLGLWESLSNPDFNYGEFAIIRLRKCVL